MTFEPTARQSPRTVPGGGLPRLLALFGGLVLIGSFASVLYGIVTVVSDGTLLLVVIAGAFGLAILLAPRLRPTEALLFGAVLLTVGIIAYAQAAPSGWRVVTDLGKVAVDVAALLTGISLLRMTEAGAWAVAFAPAPVFLTWYLLLRGEYPQAVAVGGATLVAFGLTGDAGSMVTLVGVLGGAATLGFGEIDRRGGTIADVDVLVVVLSVMVVTTVTISVVPTGAANPFDPNRSQPTIEAGFAGATDRFGIVGSISLSPSVRFIVESDRRAYWKVAAYDRYTGDGWVRSGQPREYTGTLAGPPGDGPLLNQTVTAQTTLNVLPAAWRPVDLDGDVQATAAVTSLDGLQPGNSLVAGESYQVVSRQPRSPAAVPAANTWDFPPGIVARHTQLPSDTPARVKTFTDQLAAGASGPFEVATRVENWLEANKDYSLSVPRPQGQVADRFIFEQDAGYCTYFATTMVVMLRTQGIPARLAVGYTPGQQVSEDTFVVRGLDSHAWVEVFLPGVGWTQFDPTPGGPRQAAERDRLQTARDAGEADVDAAGSSTDSYTPTGPQRLDTVIDENTSNQSENGTATGGQFDPDAYRDLADQTSDDSTGPTGLSRELLGIGLAVLVGLGAGIHRVNGLQRTRRLARVYWQRETGDPAADVRRAVDRLEYVLALRHRGRRRGETVETYLRCVAKRTGDDRLGRVARFHQLARYHPEGVSTDRAAETVDIVDALVREYAPLRTRLRSKLGATPGPPDGTRSRAR